MTSIGASILLGIVSGIFTLVIVFIFRQIWIKIIQPWYEELIYSDAKIEGRWKSEANFGGETQSESWHIKRTGHSIIGTATVLTGSDQGKTFNIEGKSRNLIFTGTYTADDPSALDRGTINLMLVNNGQTLRGYGTYYNDPEHNIKAIQYEWNREKLT